MRKILVPTLVLLALAVSTAAPAYAAATYAADAEPAAEAEVVLPLEEPIMTPAEAPEAPDLFDPARERDEKIRECEPHEAEQHCQPGCTCIFTIPKIYCIC